MPVKKPINRLNRQRFLTDDQSSHAMYQHYKPLRNYLAKHSVRSSLEIVWQHAKDLRSIDTQRTLQNSSTAMLPWELELVAREVVLNADFLSQKRESGKSLDLRKAVGLIRELNTCISEEHVHSHEDATGAVVPLIHQQMPWSDDTFSRIARYGQIYRHPPLAEIMQSMIGMSLSDWLKLGFSTYSYLNTSPSASRSDFQHLPGLDKQTVETFFSLTASSIEDLRPQVKSHQTYDRQWAHAFNSLRQRPITFFRAEPERIFAPVPQLVIWRVTDGLYYDLVGKGGAAFSKAFGDACELYVGKVLEVALRGGEFEVHAERRYDSPQGKRAGVDWLVSDCTGHLFVECKAKRLTLPAKTTGPGKSMDDDLRVLASYVVQNYKNIQDAQRGLVPGFESAGLPVFSAIVTLEDWGLYTSQLTERLHSFVEEEMLEKTVPISMMIDCPYKVLSFFQLERQAQDIANVGVAKVFAPDAIYPKAAYKGCLFPETLAELIPDMARAAGFDGFH